MVEFLKVFRLQFQKREPILVASLSFDEAIAIAKREKLIDDSDDHLVSISLINNLDILV